MPHDRSRTLVPHIEKSLKHSPIVGILGQRQTGKTTLMQSLVPETAYTTLDRAAQLSAARTAPETFIDRSEKILGIDECQLAPELFPALKEYVRTHRRPGQFLLTGSVRFTSRKLIRESLTGRIVTHELLPLTLAENHGFELGDLFGLVRLPLAKIQKRVTDRLSVVTRTMTEGYLARGGLPGICFFREKAIRTERMSSHLNTLLERDLKLVLDTTLPSVKLLRTLQFISNQQGKPLSISDLSRTVRVSAPTLQKLLPAFEALFLVRRVEPIGDRKKDCFFLEDQGMATFLATAQDAELDLLRLVYSQCLAQMKYLYPHVGGMQSYETRGGARVPLVLSVADEKVGVLPVLGEVPDSSALASAGSFLKRYPKSFVAILTAGKEVIPLGKNLYAIPSLAAY